MGFIFCSYHPLLVTRFTVSDQGPMGPLVCILLLMTFINLSKCLLTLQMFIAGLLAVMADRSNVSSSNYDETPTGVKGYVSVTYTFKRS